MLLAWCAATAVRRNATGMVRGDEAGDKEKDDVATGAGIRTRARPSVWIIEARGDSSASRDGYMGETGGAVPGDYMLPNSSAADAARCLMTASERARAAMWA